MILYNNRSDISDSNDSSDSSECSDSCDSSDMNDSSDSNKSLTFVWWKKQIIITNYENYFCHQTYFYDEINFVIKHFVIKYFVMKKECVMWNIFK